jgi:hypothetical protein
VSVFKCNDVSVLAEVLAFRNANMAFADLAVQPKPAGATQICGDL